MKNIDAFALFRNREIRRGNNGWFGWYRKEANLTGDVPSDNFRDDIFPGRSNAFPEDVKPAVPQIAAAPRAKFSPLIVSNVEVPETGRRPLMARSKPQYRTQRPATANIMPFEASQPQTVSRNPTQNTIREAQTLASTHINNTYDTNRASVVRNASAPYAPRGTRV